MTNLTDIIGPHFYGTSGDLPGSRWVHSAASSVHWENEGTIKTKKKLLKKIKDCERSLIGSGPIKTKKKQLKKIKDCERSLISSFSCYAEDC